MQLTSIDILVDSIKKFEKTTVFLHSMISQKRGSKRLKFFLLYWFLNSMSLVNAQLILPRLIEHMHIIKNLWVFLNLIVFVSIVLM